MFEDCSGLLIEKNLAFDELQEISSVVNPFFIFEDFCFCNREECECEKFLKKYGDAVRLFHHSKERYEDCIKKEEELNIKSSFSLSSF